MTFEYLLSLNDKSGKILKEKYLKRHHKEIYNDVLKYCKLNHLEQLKFTEKLYHYYHKITHQIICSCGKICFFINFNKGYCKHCSSKCAHNDIAVKEKTIKNIMAQL